MSYYQGIYTITSKSYQLEFKMGMMFPLLFYYQENVIFVLLGQLSVLTNYVNALGEGGTDDGV